MLPDLPRHDPAGAGEAEEGDHSNFSCATSILASSSAILLLSLSINRVDLSRSSRRSRAASQQELIEPQLGQKGLVIVSLNLIEMHRCRMEIDIFRLRGKYHRHVGFVRTKSISRFHDF